jgi:hypothetical protein
MKRLALLCVTVAACGATASTATAAGLSCGAVISSPGAYTLAGDLNCQGSAIDVQSDGVTLNLNGHTISGPGAATATTGVNGALTVQNGVIRNFGTGINTQGPALLTGSNLRVVKNGIGIDAFTAGVRLSGSYVNENMQDGISDALGGIVLYDSQVMRNGGNGITAHETLLLAERNVISGNGRYGIWNDEFTVTLRNNQTNNNALDGIHIGYSPFDDSYTLINNTSIGNGGHGIDYAADGGPDHHLLQSEGNIARDNRTNPQCVNIFCRTS